MDTRVTDVETTFDEMRNSKNADFVKKMEDLSILSQRFGKNYDCEFSALQDDIEKRWMDMDNRVSKYFGLQVSENYRNVQDLKRLSNENNQARLILEQLEQKIMIAEGELDIVFDPEEGEEEMKSGGYEEKSSYN